MEDSQRQGYFILENPLADGTNVIFILKFLYHHIAYFHLASNAPFSYHIHG